MFQGQLGTPAGRPPYVSVDAPHLLIPPALRALLYAGGTVASAAGFHTAVTGARSIPGRQTAADSVLESELRFYGTFYAAYGLAVLNTARHAEVPKRDLHALAAVLFAAGLARASAWRTIGKPSPQQIALLAIELGGPPAIAAWRTAVERG
jgi:hypothetical protein